jgi:hypothetical protein
LGEGVVSAGDVRDARTPIVYAMLQGDGLGADRLGATWDILRDTSVSPTK